MVYTADVESDSHVNATQVRLYIYSRSLAAAHMPLSNSCALQVLAALDTTRGAAVPGSPAGAANASLVSSDAFGVSGTGSCWMPSLRLCGAASPFSCLGHGLTADADGVLDVLEARRPPTLTLRA